MMQMVRRMVDRAEAKAEAEAAAAIDEAETAKRAAVAADDASRARERAMGQRIATVSTETGSACQSLRQRLDDHDTALTGLLVALEAIELPSEQAPNVEALQGHVSALQAAVAAIHVPPDQTAAVGALRSELDALKSTVAGIHVPADQATAVANLRAELDALKATVLAIPTPRPEEVVHLGDTAITFGGPGLTIIAGDKTTRRTVPGVAVGDVIALVPTSAVPSGFTVKGALVVSANTIDVIITTPLLTLGVTATVALRVVALR
jgi:hypothetical protein